MSIQLEPQMEEIVTREVMLRGVPVEQFLRESLAPYVAGGQQREGSSEVSRCAEML
jgi:hypothetical protein